MHYLNVALFWIFFGFLCSYLAAKKGRNPKVWFWLGIGSGVIGVLAILLLPRPKKRKKPQKAVIDSPKEVVPLQPWYALSQDKTHQGPYSIYDLQKMFKEGAIDEATYFCQEGAPQWTRLKDLPDLKKHVST